MAYFEVKGLVKKYGDNVILNNVSFSLPSKGMYAIIGESGCGKSTLLKCLLGIEKLDKGEIIFCHKKIKHFDGFRNRYTSIIFQNYNLISFLNGEENISLFNGLRSKKQDIKPTIKKVLLENKLKQDVRTLSGGEKQRFSILRSAISDPKIIFGDEVTGSLDENNALTIMDYLKEISLSHLVVLVTHNTSYLNKYFDGYLEIVDHQIKTNTIKSELEEKVEPRKFSFLKLKSIFLISFKSMLKKRAKMLLSLLSLSLSIGLFLSSYNLMERIEDLVKEKGTAFLDYNILNVSIEKETNVNNSSFTLVRTYRPLYSDLQYLLPYFNVEEFRYDYSSLLTKYPSITYPVGSYTYLTNIEMVPYSSKMLNNLKSTLDGKLPTTFSEVIVNNEAMKLLENKEFGIYLEKTIDYKDEDNLIKDNLNLDLTFKVVGSIDEFSLMQTPRIYYSLDYMEEFLGQIDLPNLSKHLGFNVTMVDRLSDLTYSGDQLVSTSMIIEVDDISKVSDLFNQVDGLKLYESTIRLTSEDITKVKMFNEVYSSFKEVINIFIFITLLISVFLLSLCLYSIVMDFKIDIGILLSLGINKIDIMRIFILQSIFISLISLLNAFFLYLSSFALINRVCVDILSTTILNILPSSFSIFLTGGILIIICLLSNASSLFGLNRMNISTILREE